MTVSTTILWVLFSIPNAYAYWREDWEADVTEKTLTPIFVLYDPPGADSYQQVTQSFTASLTLHFESGGGCIVYVKSGVSTTVSVNFATGYRSSDSSDPKYLGSGGDGIFGKKLTLHWHIWGYTMILPHMWYHRITKAELRGIQDDGYAFVARADLPTYEYKVYSVPNLRGTVGAWHYPESGTLTIGPTLTWEHYMQHSWSMTWDIEVGAKVSISYLGVTAAFGYHWSASGTGTFTYKTYVYVHDPSNYVDFTMNADAGSWGSPTATIQDYIFWFNEY